MEARIHLMHVIPGVIQAMLGLERQVQKAGCTPRADRARSALNVSDSHLLDRADLTGARETA